MDSLSGLRPAIKSSYCFLVNLWLFVLKKQYWKQICGPELFCQLCLAISQLLVTKIFITNDPILHTNLYLWIMLLWDSRFTFTLIISVKESEWKLCWLTLKCHVFITWIIAGDQRYSMRTTGHKSLDLRPHSQLGVHAWYCKPDWRTHTRIVYTCPASYCVP